MTILQSRGGGGVGGGQCLCQAPSKSPQVGRFRAITRAGGVLRKEELLPCTLCVAYNVAIQSALPSWPNSEHTL